MPVSRSDEPPVPSTEDDHADSATETDRTDSRPEDGHADSATEDDHAATSIENGRSSASQSKTVGVDDTVVYTSDLNHEYRFTVTAVTESWITFETGQQVHRSRFEREPFTVISGPSDATSAPSVTSAPDDGEVVSSDESEGSTEPHDADELLIESPN